jgi:hypothetical protein
LNIAVLFAVLEADLGRRKIGTFRILRPLLTAAAFIPLFVVHPATSGNGELLEVGLALLGAILGLSAAAGLMKVSVDHARQRAVSTAGVAYGAFWTVIIAARLLFIYGANHWYTTQLTHWLSTNGISGNALTDAMIFMAIAMAIARTVRLAVGRAQVIRHSSHELAV